MNTKAEAAKGRWMLLFWMVVLVVGYFWGLPNLGQLWETLPTPTVLKSSPPSAAEQRTWMQLNDTGRYGHVVPIGPEEAETPQNLPMQLDNPGRYGHVVPIGPEETETQTPLRNLR